MKKTLAALALLSLGFAAGTIVPRASAAEGLGEVTRQLAGIHTELTSIRRAIEGQARK